MNIAWWHRFSARTGCLRCWRVQARASSRPSCVLAAAKRRCAGREGVLQSRRPARVSQYWGLADDLADTGTRDEGKRSGTCLRRRDRQGTAASHQRTGTHRNPRRIAVGDVTPATTRALRHPRARARWGDPTFTTAVRGFLAQTGHTLEPQPP